MQDLPSSFDWVKHFPQSPKIARIEAFFSGHGFDPHRHDTYAIGRTLTGVQSFRYRGEGRNSVPGEVLVLHPDEEHDGHSGSSTGFRYRMLYITPELVQQVLQGKPLPFLKGGISRDPRLSIAVETLLNGMDDELEQLEEDDNIFTMVATLQLVCGGKVAHATGDYAAAKRAREYIDGNLEQAIGMDDLAKHAMRDRWSLSKDFRFFFGTSPHRYMTMRRLDNVKTAVFAGRALADASIEAGFFDQSHMSRHFKKTFGISPSRWFRA